MPNDVEYMQLALDEAYTSAVADEVPIGAVLVYKDAVLARSGNRTMRDNDPTAHAEILVLREAARTLGNHRLTGTVLYVTVEPCAMCAGAIVQSRIARLVYGAADPKAGACESLYRLVSDPRLNHRVPVTSEVLATECGEVLKEFFQERRAFRKLDEDST